MVTEKQEMMWKLSGKGIFFFFFPGYICTYQRTVLLLIYPLRLHLGPSDIVFEPRCVLFVRNAISRIMIQF